MQRDCIFQLIQNQSIFSKKKEMVYRVNLNPKSNDRRREGIFVIIWQNYDINETNYIYGNARIFSSNLKRTSRK